MGEGAGLKKSGIGNPKPEVRGGERVAVGSGAASNLLNKVARDE